MGDENVDFVLHSDLNCFYASVEMVENPSLRDKPIAVCGSTDDRHGIVLTKNYLAKPYGIRTGEANWQARQKCPGLIMVNPHYELYLRYSAYVKKIYGEFAENIEPFGMDECWLSLNNLKDIHEAEHLAHCIRKKIYNETGLTVSVGVSFSKIFAKLGSDMKKPDAVTVISKENYREKVFPLPVCELLYAGPATTRRLRFHNVFTIGELASTDGELIRSWLGKNGLMLHAFACGQDGTAVCPDNFTFPILSVGHGATCIRDLETNYEVWLCILDLSQDIGKRLRNHELSAQGVELAVRDCELVTHSFQTQLSFMTQSPLDLARVAYTLFRLNYNWKRNIRSLTVRAIRLKEAGTPAQLDLFGDYVHAEKIRRMEDAIYDIRARYGKNSICSASQMGSPEMAKDQCEIVPMPGMMYR